MKFPTITTAISVMLSAIFILFGPMPEALTWQSQFEISWQMVSTHFVHISGEHFAWNLVAFIILGSYLEQHSKKRLIVSLVVGLVFVNVYLLAFYPLSAYAGFSGVLNTLLVSCLFQLAQKPDYTMAAIVTFVAAIAKIMIEWMFHTAIFSSLIWPSVPEAHMAGIIGGVLICGVSFAVHKASKPTIGGYESTGKWL